MTIMRPVNGTPISQRLEQRHVEALRPSFAADTTPTSEFSVGEGLAILDDLWRCSPLFGVRESHPHTGPNRAARRAARQR